ncbi:urease accessory protein UreG [Streptomyces sp. NBC_00247]|uniref:urease accessory protein UreG n=1 Tax=Streptomyces sp. NBC_00247 TaxID=2975689 RepID=UPI002E2BA5EC|nr:urease accessory protein UreG [Streptomyces sp. NBC_00247]
MDDNVLRVGIGGPVGSGKTALIEALVPVLIARGRRPAVITNDIYTQEDAQHVRRTLAGVLDPERVVGVETGACPHTAVRDDPTMNLAAGAEMLERFPDTDTLLYESGGDNLTLTFSPALVDLFLFVLDTAEGEKMPRKRGPGITESDLLVINKIDIAQYVRTDVGVMESDAHRVRGDGPVVLTDCLTGVGIEDIALYLESRRKVLI